MKPRQTAIDYLKGALVIGMVIAHALQLLSKPKGVWWLFSTSINLITFSGFFFCFGYVFYAAYLTKSFADVSGKMAKTATKLLMAYYLSAFFSFLLLSTRFLGKPYPRSFDELLLFLTFGKVAWYSEFLLTFFLITLLVLLFFKGFKYLIDSPPTMLGLGVGCLLIASLLPPDLIVVRPFSLFLSSKNYALFPLVQYLPIFLIGLYFSKYNVVWHRVSFVLSLLGTTLFVGYYIVNRSMPPSFLPSIYWLVGSYGILYGYFLTAKWLEQQAHQLSWLLAIGRNTLFYLLLSNFFIFALSNHLQTTPGIAFLIGITLLVVLGFLLGLVTKSAPPPLCTFWCGRVAFSSLVCNKS